MSIIERAAQRLEELRRAGIEVPGQGGDSSGRNQTPPSNRRSNSPGQTQGLARVNTLPSERSAKNSAGPADGDARGYFELDLARLASAGFITPDVPRSRIADEFRIIKRPLIANVSGKKQVPIKHANLIMVTSSVAGEGKTFSAVNLAISVAMELDRTVLLVDADVARPSLPSLLGMPPTKGLLDVLEGNEVTLGDVLLATNIENLSILPSGTPHARATELLASEAMAKLLEDLSSRHADRVVIFDSPPLLVTTEARVLANQMGQIIFVVQAESTLQSDVKRALAAIESCPIKLMVLNQARTVAQGAYGYGYGYGYGG
jgi:exopolysaccharide/PEP-CTERM locus tyrosine autokinase